MASKSNATDFHLRAKAILAVRHGRELAELMSDTVNIPMGDLPGAALRDCIRRLTNGDVSDGRNLTFIEALLGEIATALVDEIVETKYEWHTMGREACEDSWTMVPIPIYTSLGSHTPQDTSSERTIHRGKTTVPRPRRGRATRETLSAVETVRASAPRP